MQVASKWHDISRQPHEPPAKHCEINPTRPIDFPTSLWDHHDGWEKFFRQVPPRVYPPPETLGGLSQGARSSIP